ncbi:MAG: DMT family transporter [Burkholderiales bacterium]
MGIALALLAMLSFATNIVITRYAIARMPVEGGFFVVLATNILFPAVIFASEFTVRTAGPGWQWKPAGIFALGGIVGTFLGRRFLFDAVKLLGPSRASVFHSTAPAFALIAAWLLAGEVLGLYELALMTLVWFGLWLTQPRAGSGHAVSPEVMRKGFLAGLLMVTGFGFGNVLRGIAMRDWHEAALGTVISSAAALACQVMVTRDWGRIAAQLRAADRTAILLYAGCGVATSLGSIFVSLAMTRIEIALAVLFVHSTPIVIFPLSVFVMKNREELTGRAVIGATLVLAGIALLALR